MFKDILGPDKNGTKDYDDFGFYRDNEAKEAIFEKNDEEPHPEDCQCEDCLEEAIKELCDQMGIDLDDEELNDIKIEYYNQDDDETVSLKPKILTAMTITFLRKVIKEEGEDYYG